MAPPDTGDEVVDLLLSVGHHVREQVNETLRARVNLTLPRLKVLAFIAEAGPSRLCDLASAVSVARRTMTETADGLEADGLVARTVHPGDRRSVLLELTPTGRATLARARAAVAETVRGCTAPLSPDERAFLVTALHRLRGQPALNQSGMDQSGMDQPGLNQPA